jgi:hypothetical protein
VDFCTRWAKRFAHVLGQIIASNDAEQAYKDMKRY